MKRNIITSIISWLAKRSSSVFFTILITSLLFSCKKEGDFNLGNNNAVSEDGVQYETTALINNTLLLNDSLISASPNYLAFGGYSDAYTGDVFAEAYTTVGLFYNNIDYTGAVVDSANLYVNYTVAYGDTLQNQDISVYQITTQLSSSVPYKTTTDFVTYDPTELGTTNFQARPLTVSKLRIPLSNAFAASLLSSADDKTTTDFQSSFYGIMLKSKTPSSIASVIRANYSVSSLVGTRLIVYFKRGNQSDSASFTVNGSAGFNKIYSNRNASDIASLVKNRDSIPPVMPDGICFVQSGTGVVTKVEMPDLETSYKVAGEQGIIINKAQLTISMDPSSDIPTFRQATPLALLEVNPDNTYKYRSNGQLAYVQATGYNQTSTGSAVFATATTLTATTYTFDITSYIQAILQGKLKNDGFIITPTINAYLTNRSVIYSSTAANKPMKLEIYYTKVK